MSQPAVFVVDDNPIVIDSLRVQIARFGYRWAGSLERADDLERFVDESRADVVLLDIDMPGKDPWLALRELHEVRPNVCVVMLSGFVSKEMVDLAFENGANGYLSKSDCLPTLKEAISRAVGGEFVMSPAVRESCCV